MRKYILALTSAAFVATTAFAYDEIVVHPHMTRTAFAAALSRHDFLKSLNLLPSTQLAGFTPVEYAAKGAMDEDAGTRPLNHFFDGSIESPLVPFGPFCVRIPLFNNSARDWALGSISNLFDLSHAQSHLRSAVTSPNPSVRELETAALFESLGHVMHLVQDMGQPQHARNDNHLMYVPSLASRYERWCATNLNVGLMPFAQGTYTGYPVVDLLRFPDYFKDGNDRGLTEYSNQNFVTEHSNYSDVRCPPYNYPWPFLSMATPRQETHTVNTTSFDPSTNTLNVTSVQYNDTVYTFPTFDAYLSQTIDNPNHTFYSYFDFDMQQVNGTRVYSLPESALASQADLLVRRSVGYSAGILSHFFRGEMKADWQQTSPGVYTLTLTNLSADPFSGTLQALYRVPPGTHGATGGSDLVSIDPSALGVAVTLPPSGSMTIPNVTVAGLAAGESLLQFERRFLFDGSLGADLDLPVALIQPAGPNRLEMTATYVSGTADPGLEIVDVSQNGMNFMIGTRNGNVQTMSLEMKDGHQYRGLLFRSASQSPTIVQIEVKIAGQVQLTHTLNLGGNDVAAWGCYRTPTTTFSYGVCDNYILRNFYCADPHGCFSIEPW